MKKQLQKWQNNTLTLRSDFERNKNSKHYALKTTDAAFRLLNGKLYHKLDNYAWLAFSPDSKIPAFIKLPEE